MKRIIISVLFLIIVLIQIQAEEYRTPVGGIKSLFEKIVFPESEIELNRESKVILEVFVDEEGEITDVVIRQTAGDAYDQASIDAVMKTKFIPAEKDGKKVKGSVIIPFTYKHHGHSKKEKH